MGAAALGIARRNRAGHRVLESCRGDERRLMATNAIDAALARVARPARHAHAPFAEAVAMQMAAAWAVGDTARWA